MTTIATDGLSMAGDGKCGNPTYHCDVLKVRRAKDGSILGCCGTAFDMEGFLRWHEEGGEIAVSDEFDGLVLRPDGTIICVNDKGRTFVHAAPAAVGSGCPIAYGAMDAGASPEEAVSIAAKRDSGTGGTITVLHLERARQGCVSDIPPVPDGYTLVRAA